MSGCRGQGRLGKIARAVPYVIRFIPGHPTQVRDGRRALCPRGSVRPLVSQLTGDLLDHELPSVERDRVTGALSLQLSIDRSLPSHTNLPVDTAIMKSRAPGVTTALHSTLLFGAKSIADILNLVGVRVVPSKASDRSLASSACPCSSSSIGPLLSSRALPTYSRYFSLAVWRSHASSDRIVCFTTPCSAHVPRRSAGPPLLRQHQRA
jgi:hypothetical protein